ncbi:probable apyrase 7 [Malania oleifera]|uniref:probable apyrase 7 n=1 Tax=Malania oleifera TaxID=397392 RepID=UPI0025ADA953|nr:probable apyrase 7 [Malania oleifera]XP_057952808.1 probable apyrase 7 [Malania oleifera]XP_057952809.1 probable apyrase 7 [Malania oleifera]XP_057952810.1 probable apyrase 7 [Malania oleifera]
MEPRSPSKFKPSFMGFFQYRRVLKISIIFILVVLLLVGVYHAFDIGGVGKVLRKSYFSVVIDCGSTGTRVNAYEWTMKDESDWDLPVLVHEYPGNSTETPLWKSGCQYHCMQTEPGLDKFVGNLSGVRASLEPLILLAEQWVPEGRHGDTPIFVLATAGLRRLPIEDAKWILEAVEAIVKEHKFVNRKSWIRVLNGKEEAYYGWVALNYKMGMLGNSSRLPTLGLLDLGGSSLQVVVEVDEPMEDEQYVRSKIGLVEHKILAYSFPAFGLNKAFDRTVIMLSQVQSLRRSASGRFELRHPCLSSGFVQNHNCSDCIRLNSTSWPNTGGKLWDNESASIDLVGDPDWKQCHGLARAAASNSSSSDWSSLTGTSILNLTAVSHLATQFHALSGFFAVYSELNLSLRANLTDILGRGQQLCLRSWADKSVSRNQIYAEQYCFRVPYVVSLIDDALSIGNAEIIFGPADISWTLGAALVEREYLASTTKIDTGILSPKIKKVIFSPILIFVLLLCLLFFVYYSQIKLPMLGKKQSAVRVGASLPSYIYPKQCPN